MGKNNVERTLGMDPCGDARELGHERARHRDIGLGAIDRIGPMHRDRSAARVRLAPRPIFRSHMHAKWRRRFLGVGHDVNFVPPRRKRVGRPVCPHADAALDRREFAHDANSQRRSSSMPALASSAMSSSAPGNSPSAVQSSSAARRSNTSAVQLENLRLARYPRRSPTAFLAWPESWPLIALEDGANVECRPQQYDAADAADGGARRIRRAFSGGDPDRPARTNFRASEFERRDIRQIRRRRRLLLPARSKKVIKLARVFDAADLQRRACIGEPAR